MGGDVSELNAFLACCTPVSVEERNLLTAEEARRLEAMFKVFANETRLRLLHALVRESDLGVSEISRRIGMRPQAVSNQLQRLQDRGVVASRREGNLVRYRVVDPCVGHLLEYGLCLTQDAEGRSR